MTILTHGSPVAHDDAAARSRVTAPRNGLPLAPASAAILGELLLPSR
jgi:hypothetical protein